MVEHLYRDPERIDILESEVRQQHPGRRGGPCLVCGAWIEPESEDVLDVTVGRDGVAELAAVAHPACLARVVHDPSSLPA
jgi:hypothetical protein